LFPAICSGQSIVIAAITDKGVHWGVESVETRLSRSAAGLVLEGAKKFVFDAESATSFLCAART